MAAAQNQRLAPIAVDPWLTAKDLRIQLARVAPGVSGYPRYNRLLPLLPYVYLPGGRRKMYRLSMVLETLERLQTVVRPSLAAADSDLLVTPLHRRRAKRKAS